MNKLVITIKELFYILTFSLIIFSGLEIIWPRLVLAYINLNLVLALWLVNGIILLVINKKKESDNI